MKVVHILWGFHFGGVETLLVNMANCQVQLGADVTIIVINDMCEETLLRSIDKRIKLILFRRKVHSKGLGFILRLNHELNKIVPDVVHLHSSKLFGIILNRKLSRVTCTTLHDLPQGAVRRSNLLERTFPISNFLLPGNVAYIDKIPLVFSISQAVQQDLKREHNVDSIVVNNGIPTSSFQQRPLRNPHSPRRIVQVSRLVHEKKGQDLLIEAVARMQGKVEVDFIGDGESLKYLKELTRKLKAEPFVHFLGNKTQAYITQHLCNYDLLVQPSRYEGFGLTVAEAMATQLPVLVSAGQGPAEVTCGEKYGWTFENGNVSDLEKKINYIFDHYNNVLTKVQEAKNYVMNTYDISITTKHYMQEYKRLHKNN